MLLLQTETTTSALGYIIGFGVGAALAGFCLLAYFIYFERKTGTEFKQMPRILYMKIAGDPTAATSRTVTMSTRTNTPAPSEAGSKRVGPDHASTSGGLRSVDHSPNPSVRTARESPLPPSGPPAP